MVDKIIDVTEEDKGYKFTKVDWGIQVYWYFVPRENNQIILPQYDGSFDCFRLDWGDIKMQNITPNQE